MRFCANRCNAELTPRTFVVGTLPSHVADSDIWKGVQTWEWEPGVPKLEEDVMRDVRRGLENNLKQVTKGHR